LHHQSQAMVFYNNIISSQPIQVARTLGKAKISHSSSQSGLRLATAYRRLRQLPPTITHADIDGDNVIHYFSDFCSWAACTQNVAWQMLFYNTLPPTHTLDTTQGGPTMIHI
jgi:hypothetical protein